MADTTNNADQKGTYHQIRDQYYYVEISMYNQIEKQKPLNVPFFFVDSLKIHEGLHTWITKAEIVFNSDFEIFARGAQKISSDPNNTDVKAPYIDRTDGRNRIHIKIYPVDMSPDGSGAMISSSNNSTKFEKKYWEMDYDFVVYDMQDLPTPNVQIKKKMYMLIDERCQILKEKNLEWSSATMSAKRLAQQARYLKDSKAAINANDALKDLLTLVSTNGDTMEKIKIGFDQNGSIDKPTIDFDKTGQWDVGKDDNKVSFHPSANSTALDDMFYILSHCKSSDDFPVLLDYGRSSEDKGWHLISLSEYFKNSTKEQVERLILEDGLAPDPSESTGNTSNDTPYVPRADDSAGTQTKNFTSIVASKITKYNYSPMVALDDARIMNSPLCYFDEHTGFFNLKKKNNTAKNVIEKLKELAKLGLYNFKKSNDNQKPQILINLNKTKTSGQMTKNEFAINGPYCLHDAPLHQMLLDAIFLNQCISFQTLGLTLRTPGKFIFVDRVASGDINPFDDKFLGQWLMTKVTHLFTQETYVNEIVANKVDSYSQLWPEEDNNY
jgi:hypothetical protein